MLTRLWSLLSVCVVWGLVAGVIDNKDNEELLKCTVFAYKNKLYRITEAQISEL